MWLLVVVKSPALPACPDGSQEGLGLPEKITGQKSTVLLGRSRQRTGDYPHESGSQGPRAGPEFGCRNVPEHPGRCTGLAPEPMGEMGHIVKQDWLLKLRGVPEKSSRGQDGRLRAAT